VEPGALYDCAGFVIFRGDRRQSHRDPCAVQRRLKEDGVILGSLGGVPKACVTQSRERLTLASAASISDWPGAAK
jgi:hypothetical protein